jgi:starch-binding outer membrane protein, SusD/RagB family
MKKIFILLILIAPAIVKAQNDATVSAIQERLYNEITGEQLLSKTSWMIGECTSDNSEVGGANTSDYSDAQEMMLFNTKACNNLTTAFWNRGYDVIFLSNIMMAFVENTSFSANEKKRIIAESKFLRSLMYFELVRNFGQVPLYLDTVGWNFVAGNVSVVTGLCYTNNWNKPQSTVAEVFSQIENDLVSSIDGLPEKTELTNLEKYKATKGAAKALLAKIYLYQSSYVKKYPGDNRFSGLTEQWNKVLQYTEEVINSGQYTLTGSNGEQYTSFWDGSYLYANKTPGFRYIFTAAGNYSSESVFECKDDHTGWAEWTNNAQTVFTTCRYYKNASNVSQSGNGWGFNIPTTDLVDEFKKESGKASDDPRFQVTIATDTDKILVNTTWQKMDFHNLPYQTSCRKFECSYDEFWILNSWFDSPFNVRLIRFADVYLMAAEAAFMSGDNAKAIQYINKVRIRARMSGNTGFPKDLTTVTFDDIMHERRLELALEGHRFYDLVRWNLADAKLNGRYNASFKENVSFMKGKNEFLPIPDAIVNTSNGIIQQNPGYDGCASVIKGIEQKSSIQLFPVPSNNYLNLSSLNQLSAFSIIDIDGRSVMSGTLFGKSEVINISKLRSGVYFIRLSGQNTSEIMKFIKK